MIKSTNNTLATFTPTPKTIREKKEGLPSFFSLIGQAFSPTSKKNRVLFYLQNVKEAVKKSAAEHQKLTDVGNTLDYYSNYYALVDKIQHFLKFYLVVPKTPINALQRATRNKKQREKVLIYIQSWAYAQIEISKILSITNKELAHQYLYTALDNLKTTHKHNTSTIENFRSSIRKGVQNSTFCENVVSLLTELNIRCNYAKKFILSHLQ